jgi:DNA-binding response OmpR family regulator
VEDDPDIRLVTKLLLETHYDARVIESADGTDALKLAEEENPSLILMDLVLPNNSGLDISRKIHVNDATSHIPIILVSDHCWDVKIQERAREVGLINWIDKSHLVDQLDNRVAPFLGKSLTGKI